MGSKKDRNRGEKVVDDEGQQYRLQGMGMDYEPRQGSLSPKRNAEHRLVLNVSHKITWEGAQKAYRGEEQMHLDLESQVMFTMGCWDCEKPFEEIKDMPICLAPESPS